MCWASHLIRLDISFNLRPLDSYLVQNWRFKDVFKLYCNLLNLSIKVLRIFTRYFLWRITRPVCIDLSPSIDLAWNFWFLETLDSRLNGGIRFDAHWSENTVFWRKTSIRVKYWRKLVKKSSKNMFFVKLTYLQRAGTHSDPPFERASKNLTIETLRHPFRAKLEVSIPNPPTENQLLSFFGPIFSLKFIKD